MSTAESPPSLLLTVVTFLVVGGAFGVGLAMSLHHESPVETVAEPIKAPPEDLMKVYYPFPVDIYITRPDRTMVIAAVSFYLENSPEALLHLQGVAKERQSELQAALLAAAEQQAEISTNLDAYRADLPAALLTKVNEMLGTAEDEAPVKEVVFTKFVSR